MLLLIIGNLNEFLVITGEYMNQKTASAPAAENKMGTMPIGRLLFNMSLPMMVSMLVQALYNIVDSLCRRALRLDGAFPHLRHRGGEIDHEVVALFVQV